jgi:hypothetical protein
VLGNYDITYNTAAFTIKQKAASVTPDAASKTYGAVEPTLTGTLSGFLTADGVTAVYSRAAGETVAGGPYTISAVLSPSEVLGNYDITYNTAAFTIKQKAASVTPDAASKTYGAVEPTLTGTITGFLPADGVTATYTRTPGEAVGTYTISAVLSPSEVLGNYDITYNTAAFTIKQKAASVTPNAASKTYGEIDPALTGTLSGFLEADVVTATYSRAAGETVGGSPYTISATLSPAGVLGNYDITYNTAAFTIGKKAASVTPNAAGKTYGEIDPTLTGTLTGFLPADGVTATYTRTPGEAVGTYTISATLSPTGVLGNYAITYNTAVFTINNYVFGGFGPPLMISRTNYKQTSTIPVKFKLFDNSGNPVSYAVARLTVNGVAATSSGGSNTGNLFRYDSSGKQYIFNLTTKPLVIGVNTLTVTLDDGKSYSWTITLR